MIELEEGETEVESLLMELLSSNYLLNRGLKSIIKGGGCLSVGDYTVLIYSLSCCYLIAINGIIF
jgi:hypothetical protein